MSTIHELNVGETAHIPNTLSDLAAFENHAGGMAHFGFPSMWIARLLILKDPCASGVYPLLCCPAGCLVWSVDRSVVARSVTGAFILPNQYRPARVSEHCVCIIVTQGHEWRNKVMHARRKKGHARAAKQ